MALTLAGRRVEGPLEMLVQYADRQRRTLDRYDFGQPGEPDRLTIDDVRGTRVIASRISEAEAHELVAIAANRSDLWSAVPVGATLRDADPVEAGGLYDAMESLFESLRLPGVYLAKVSKGRHPKRPHPNPIRRKMTVVGERLVHELNGRPCLPL
jgi:hypothetical protein